MCNLVKKGERLLRKGKKKGKGLVRKGVVKSKKLARQVWTDPMTKEFLGAEKRLVATTLKKLGKRVKKELRKR